MKADRVIVDTGPIVAILNRADSNHSACYTQGLQLPRPLLTTWPVITEAAWLLRGTFGGVSALLRMIATGLLECYPLDSGSADWMDKYLEKYADQKPQLADASLLYVAEKEQIDTIFSLDKRDFLVYRLAGNRGLRLVPE